MVDLVKDRELPYWMEGGLRVKTVQTIDDEQVEKYLWAICDELNNLSATMFSEYGFTYAIHKMKESDRSWGEAFYHGDWEISFFDQERITRPTLFELNYQSWGKRACVLCKNIKFAR